MLLGPIVIRHKIVFDIQTILHNYSPQNPQNVYCIWIAEMCRITNNNNLPILPISTGPNTFLG